MIFGMTYYQICMYFLIYSFLGWCVEVVYHALKVGKVINRGFLNGPVCPVYGFGMLAVLAMANALPRSTLTNEPNIWMEFLLGMLLATAVEFVAGFLLYHIFHARWWDYSRLPGNIGGYICPLFSVLWGIAIVLVLKLVHPFTQQISNSFIPEKYGWPVMLVLYIIYLIDFIATVLTVSGFNKKLKQLDEVDQKLRTVSDGLSQMLGENTIKTTEKVQEGRVQAALAKADLKDAVDASIEDVKMEKAFRDEERAQARAQSMENIKSAHARMQENRGMRHEASMETREQLLKRYADLREDLVSHTHFGTGRLLQAFPDMKHRDYERLVNRLKQYQSKEKEGNRK